MKWTRSLKIAWTSSEECSIYFKKNTDGLFVVSDLEHCINFEKDTVTEKELVREVMLYP